MPSPTIATNSPVPCSSFTTSDFSEGNTCAYTLSIPTCEAIAIAVSLLSPVIIATFIPIECKRSTALLLVSFIVSETYITAARSSFIAKNIGVFPCLASIFEFFNISESISRPSISFMLPSMTLSPAILALIPIPVMLSKSSIFSISTFIDLALVIIASAKGCSDLFSSDAAILIMSLSP